MCVRRARTLLSLCLQSAALPLNKDGGTVLHVTPVAGKEWSSKITRGYVDAKAEPEHQALLNVANNKGITPLMVMICSHIYVGLDVTGCITLVLWIYLVLCCVLCVPCDDERTV